MVARCEAKRQPEATAFGCHDSASFAYLGRRNWNNSLLCSWPVWARFMPDFGLQTGTRPQIVKELTVAMGFFGAGLAGLWVTPWIVPAAYTVHGICDYAHHKSARFAPISYMVSAILRYDWVAAIGLAVVWVLRG